MLSGRGGCDRVSSRCGSDSRGSGSRGRCVFGGSVSRGSCVFSGSGSRGICVLSSSGGSLCR